MIPFNADQSHAAGTSNRLLLALPATEREQVLTASKRVNLGRCQVLYEVDEPIAEGLRRRPGTGSPARGNAVL